MQVNPVSNEGGDGADHQEKSESGQQDARAVAARELQANEGGNQEKKALSVADGDVVQQGLGGHHPLCRKKEECGVNEADHDGDLKEIEKDLGLHADAPIGFRQEEHHQDRSAIETVQQAPRRS